jgi:hypothetical protein
LEPQDGSRLDLRSEDSLMHRNRQQNAQNANAGKANALDGHGAKNGGAGSHKKAKDKTEQGSSDRKS